MTFYTQSRDTMEEYMANIEARLGPSLTAKTSSLRPASPAPGTSSTSADIVEKTSSKTMPKFRSQGTNSKLDELMKKQTCNFKAFSRTVANINIDLISEKWEFEDTLKTLEARWSLIDTLHWELDGELEGEDSAYEELFSTHEKTFNLMKRSLNSKLWSVSHRHKSTPKMEIPVFHGNYQQWVSFKDLFTETIHNNPSLSNAQKMQFLKNKVKGEPESLLQHLNISSDNDITCWDILNHRYNNKKLIFISHVKTLMNIPIMQQPSLSSIKRIHDTTHECLNAIKNLGVDTSTWDPLIVYILSNKLDSETYKDYTESLKQPRELEVLSEFLQFLEKKFTSMESSRHKQDVQKLSTSNTKSYKEINSHKYHNPKQSYSSNKTVSQSLNSRKFHNKTCPLCKNDHGLFQCDQFIAMSPISKKQTVAKLKLCENCLYSHNGKECLSTKRCRECNEYHNTILHEAFAQSSMKSDSLAVTKHGPACTSTEQAQQVNSHVAQQRDFPEILLATAEIKVQKLDGSYLIMRALIDQGSQTSLITENAAQQLTGAGIVVIDSGCIIKTQYFTVTAHKQQSSELNIKPYVYAPEIPPINNIINISIPHYTQNGSGDGTHDKELTYLGQRIKVMKDSTLLSESISYHDIHHYTLIYCIIGVAAVIGLALVWRRVRAWHLPAAPPAPAQAQEPRAPGPPGARGLSSCSRKAAACERQ